MNVTNIFLVVFSITGAILSASFTFMFRTKQKAEIEFYQRNNDELRASNNDLRQEKSDCESQVVQWKSKYEEQSKLITELKDLNAHQADFTGLTKLISNNHKDVIRQLTSLAKLIVKEPNGKR